VRVGLFGHSIRMPAEEETMNPAEIDRHSRIAREEATDGSRTSSHPMISRRAAIGGVIGGALVTTLTPQPAAAREPSKKQAPLVLLLRGLYQPVVDGPDLGLSTVDLNDGSYSTTKIYPVMGVPGHTDVLEAIGDFYVQFAGMLCAYDLPGGAIAMEFTGSNTILVPDGSGGSYVQGTFELDIPEASGRYRSLEGGHNRMVDSLHLLASGNADEFCVCLITRP
jgi:hypothetical protein